ncbi:MAG: shikimate dehydrogenase [Gammaproteobacteria bacterium]|nr:MAG: shikimate dehydrogenase [Gammaproteobacteria bacterium]
MGRQTARYAVIGDPIGHSRSPAIHARFAEQTGQQLSYEAIRVPAGTLAVAVAGVAAAGGCGVNVTVPLKEEAFRFAGSRTERAERAGAVNTLVLDGPGAPLGDNTDGVGLVRDLKINLGVELAGRSLLVLGAGGAVRGILGPLLAERPLRLVIANRTARKAVDLALEFNDLGPVSGGGFEALADSRFDVVINGTAASLQGAALPLPETLIIDGGFAYDLVYASEPTPFLDWAGSHGIAGSADGLGMLVEQAAESFTLWRGVRPQTGPVIEALRAENTGS